jgi:hypothetical protein
MNLIDEFFAATDWRQVVELLGPRRRELFDDAAAEAMERRLKMFSQSEACTQVLYVYLEFLKAAATGKFETMEKIANCAQKLSDDELHHLALVKDIPSARSYLLRSQETALQLLQGHILGDDAFWIMLLATASSLNVKRTQSGTLAKTTVCVASNGIVRRVFKILPLADGGFAMTAPYHKARSGSLMKVPQTTKTGKLELSVENIVPFSASDRVKLSYHRDGFVQFSGENSQKIRSGRDPVSGEPRGLGLFSHPLDRSIQTGPSVGCSVWGVGEFEEWRPRSGEYGVVFDDANDGDFYVETANPDDELASTTHGFHISAFPIPARLVTEAVGPWETGDTTELIFPMNIYNRRKPLPVKLVLASPNCALAMIAMRQRFGFPGSGFQLGGPGDGQHVMMAHYPAISLPETGESLDWKSDAANQRKGSL